MPSQKVDCFIITEIMTSETLLVFMEEWSNFFGSSPEVETHQTHLN